MARNVFGTPITNATLRAMPEYEEREITRIDKARVAFNMKNARGNDSDVLQFVTNLGNNSERDIATLCVLYNATGDTLRYAKHHDTVGNLGKSPWPVTIANGQWAGFAHVTSNDPRSGSWGSVVYRGKNALGKECDWMISWVNDNNPKKYGNGVSTTVGETAHIQGDNMTRNKDESNSSGLLVSTCVSNGCTSSESTSVGFKPIVEAIFSLEHADEEEEK